MTKRGAFHLTRHPEDRASSERLEGSVRRRDVRRVDRPDLLDIVEAADFRAEQVDHHVTGVDQHPVAVRQALDFGAAVAGLLEGAQQVVGQGADVTVRPARRYDQAVGERGLVLEVDEDDVFGLVVVETGQDQLVQGPGRDLLRGLRGVAAQRTAP